MKKAIVTLGLLSLTQQGNPVNYQTQQQQLQIQQPQMIMPTPVGIAQPVPPIQPMYYPPLNGGMMYGGWFPGPYGPRFYSPEPRRRRRRSHSRH